MLEVGCSAFDVRRASRRGAAFRLAGEEPEQVGEAVDVMHEFGAHAAAVGEAADEAAPGPAGGGPGGFPGGG